MDRDSLIPGSYIGTRLERLDMGSSSIKEVAE